MIQVSWLFLLVGLLSGCGREEVQTYEIPKQAPLVREPVELWRRLQHWGLRRMCRRVGKNFRVRVCAW